MFISYEYVPLAKGMFRSVYSHSRVVVLVLMVLQVILLRAWHVQENLVNAEVQRDCAVLILQKEQLAQFSSFWLGILK